MSRLIGVINLDHELDQLKELTYFRCGAAVPFASRYRLIDFTLSNMMHAGVHDIALFIRRKYRSLLDHLGEGRPWDLDRRRGGLFILPPDWNDPTDASRGDLQHVHNNLDFFIAHRGKPLFTQELSMSIRLISTMYTVIIGRKMQMLPSYINP